MNFSHFCQKVICLFEIVSFLKNGPVLSIPPGTTLLLSQVWNFPRAGLSTSGGGGVGCGRDGGDGREQGCASSPFTPECGHHSVSRQPPLALEEKTSTAVGNKANREI